MMKSHDRGSKIIRYIFTLMVLMLTLNLSIGAQAKTSEKTAKSSGDNKATQEKQDSERFISIDFK